MFETSKTGIPRRAFLFMPFAFGGLVLVSHRKEKPVANADQPGNGAEVTIVPFDDSGRAGEPQTVRRVVHTDDEWRELLDSREFQVARKSGTERAFTGQYWDHHEDGMYRCVACGTALFRSADKFDSGTGWPSYTRPAAEQNVSEHRDMSLFMERVEVRCARCESHLGHVFPDGPGPAGLRYCINSAALRFDKSGG